jgi:hypothetical protein
MEGIGRSGLRLSQKADVLNRGVMDGFGSSRLNWRLIQGFGVAFGVPC